MTRQELDLLAWLAVEQRPVSHLVAMSCTTANAWVRGHGGKMRHIDALSRLRDGLIARQSDQIENVPKVLRWRA